MREAFSHYYVPDDAYFEELWTDSLIVLDTNALLNLYQVSVSTRDALLGKLKALQERLWLPHQVADEFHRNRLSAIEKINSQHNETTARVEKAKTELLKYVTTHYQGDRHPHFDVQAFEDVANDAFGSMLEYVAECRPTQPGELETAKRDDPILKAVTELYEDRVGPPFAGGKLKEVLKDAKRRVAEGIPPGFKDADKPDGGVGDYILWRQMLDFAASEQSSMIFVTDDLKEDWWSHVKRRTVGPRPELRAEFESVTSGMKYYQYRSSVFLTRAGGFLDATVDESTIAELEALRNYSSEGPPYQWSIEFHESAAERPYAFGFRLMGDTLHIREHHSGVTVSVQRLSPAEYSKDTLSPLVDYVVHEFEAQGLDVPFAAYRELLTRLPRLLLREEELDF